MLNPHVGSMDLLKLIDLVSASPSRFVPLNDGRFLAQTEQLRHRLGELAAYGERKNDSLRFPQIRAMALSDLDEWCTLKADKHWNACLKRIENAGDVVAEVPSTINAELRDYRIEGFRWRCRLAHWGAGACLADDMGLGKTLQAIALLLRRAAEGPALVIAPTSVCFNWEAELRRFAPTSSHVPHGRLSLNPDRNSHRKSSGRTLESVSIYQSRIARFDRTVSSTLRVADRTRPRSRSESTTKTTGATFLATQNQVSSAKRIAATYRSDGARNAVGRGSIDLRSVATTCCHAALRKHRGKGRHVRILAEIMRLRRACCHPSLLLPDCGLPGAIEEKILELHSTKRELAESLLEGSESTGRLSAEELLALIR